MRFSETGMSSDDFNGDHREHIETLSSSENKTGDCHFNIDSILCSANLTSDGHSSSGALLSPSEDEGNVSESKLEASTRSYSNIPLPHDEVRYPSTVSGRNKDELAVIPSNDDLYNTGKDTIIPLQKDLLLGENNTCQSLSLLDNPVKTSPPLVLDVPKISASITTANKKEICLDGLKYSPNISPLCPLSPGLRSDLNASSPVQEFDEICLKECKDATFGANIQAPGDLVLNQYVDFNGGLPDHSGIIVTDSSPPDNCCIRYKYAWIALIFIMFLIGAITVATILIQADNTAGAVDPDGQSSANYTERLIKRGQWSSHIGATFDDLTVNPPRNVIVCHSADFFCKDRVICENRVRAIESYHVQIGFTGIGYSFLIGGDGHIYEGRGWGKYGAFCAGVNCNSIGVGFIGNYDNDRLTATMVDAFNVLTEEGVRRGALIADYKLFGHYQVKKGASSSPGLSIIEAMKSWPHFTKQFTESDKC